MASCRRSGATRTQNGEDAVGDALQQVAEGLAQLQEALRLEKQEAEPKVQEATVASTSAASSCEAPATGGAAAGGGEEPPSSSPTPTSSGAGRQGAAADEEERARQRVELRVREVELKMEEAQTSPSPLGEQLCKAAREGRLSDVRLVIDCGADVNYIDASGSTPLINATCKAHADVVYLLLQRGADANAVHWDGYTALHCAAERDRSGRCVELLVGAGADVEARDEYGETPLHWAAYKNNEEAVRALLASGARRDLRACGGGWKDKTPFDLATSSNIKALLRLQHQE